MDLIGERQSAASFHHWVARTINNYGEIVERAVHKTSNGEELEPGDILHTRYEVDGRSGADDWPNFQLDGFGTWLWALGEHTRLSADELSEDLLTAARLVADYLSALWRQPCSDCWEEFPDEVHTYTLGAIYAGLKASASLVDPIYDTEKEKVHSFILENCVQNGRFMKYVGWEAVDASLLGLAVPYGVITPENAIMLATVEEIEATLRAGGGVHRYTKDTFYGGGEWVLLTAWLGWYYSKIGDFDKASALMKWVEAQADENGWLPEQIPSSLNDTSFYEPWRRRWGDIATPLLWSHANYLILHNNLLTG
jgi:GH15 family glucan-1,4-alpha-glucosidase